MTIERLQYTQEDREQTMFGMPQAILDEMINRSIGPKLMLAMSILSDSQELLAMDRNEEARQLINRAKYVMSKEMEKELTAR